MHFRWYQSHRTFKYELLSSGYSKEMVNHFECHPEVSDKGKLIRNLNHYCEVVWWLCRPKKPICLN